VLILAADVDDVDLRAPIDLRLELVDLDELHGALGRLPRRRRAEERDAGHRDDDERACPSLNMGAPLLRTPKPPSHAPTTRARLRMVGPPLPSFFVCIGWPLPQFGMG